jgi:putative endopeptidase
MKINKLLFATLFSSLVITANAQKNYLDQTTIDKSVRPGDDFYAYANGSWLKTAEIPSTENQWGNAAINAKQTRTNLYQLLMDLSAAKTIKGSNADKLKAFFETGMDTATIDQLGYTPVKADLTRIAAIKDKAGVLQETISQYAGGLVRPLFSLGSLADPIDNKYQILSFSQGGVGLPEKNYYFKEDEKSVNIRNKYVAYMQQLLQLTGEPEQQAATKAKAILDLEIRLAKGARTATENRNIAKQLNYFTPAELQSKYPSIPWANLMQQLNITTPKIMVGQPEFFEGLEKQLNETPIETWKDYLKVRMLSPAANFLSTSFQKAWFDFYSTTLLGQTQMRPRWELMITQTDVRLGEALGQLYVDKYFTPDAKKRITDLVQNIVTTFGERIKANTWMTDSTKQKALTKLNAFRVKVGYPDKWRDYSKLQIGNNYYGNIKAAAAFEFADQVAHIGKLVDRDKWGMTPPTLNAYYSALNNEIVFPAGILLFPWFDKDADDAINYGAIGSVIGHEISHGFDDNGSQFDAVGKFNNWWAKTDLDNFKAKGTSLAEQFNQYVALDTLHVNGRLTLGENIGDLGGVTVAYHAFKKTKQGQSNQLIDGLTPDQRFFLAYAAIWRKKQRDEGLRTQVLTDTHSPSRFRVNGPLSNFDPFYRAFDIKQGDKLWRPENERILIW